jgi:alkanesulfonate monooxygenase
MGAIKLGIGFGGWCYGLPNAEIILAYIDQAEAWNVDSIWLSDHLLHQTPELETLTMLSVIASRTKKMKFGASVLLLPLRQLLVVAKAIATLDFLAPGRIIVGVGLGANPQEFAACGVPLTGRGERVDEGITLLRRLWTESHITYAGKYYQLQDVTLEPKPTKQPHIDLWVGGRSDAAFRRIARLADGWFASRVTPDTYQQGMKKIRQYAEEYGRNPAKIESGVLIFTQITDTARQGEQVLEAFAQLFPEPELVKSCCAVGTSTQCVAKIQRYVEAGADKFVLWPMCPPDALLLQLEWYVTEIMSQFC